MNLTPPPPRRRIRWKNLGYRTFTAGCLLLTLYGGYLYSLRVYNYFQKKKAIAAENLAAAEPVSDSKPTVSQ